MGHSVQTPVPVEVAEHAAAMAARQLGRDGRPQLLQSGMNVAFRVNDTVVRVSSPDVDVAGQVALANWLADQGLPVLCPMAGPVVVDGVKVTVWEFIAGDACIDYRQLGGAITGLHRLDPASVAEHVALPWCGDAAWLDVGANLDAAAMAAVVTDEDISLLRSAARDLAGWQLAADHAGAGLAVRA